MYSNNLPIFHYLWTWRTFDQYELYIYASLLIEQSMLAFALDLYSHLKVICIGLKFQPTNNRLTLSKYFLG